MQIKRK